jgi:chromosome segregation ATPase
MTTLTDRLHKVQEQVARLVSEHKALRERATELETASRDHQRTSEVLTARVAELEKENEVLRKVKSEHEGLVGTGSKERIDELVNEIDRCLALIQN